jgi:hypothetical protein
MAGPAVGALPSAFNERFLMFGRDGARSLRPFSQEQITSRAQALNGDKPK